MSVTIKFHNTTVNNIIFSFGNESLVVMPNSNVEIAIPNGCELTLSQQYESFLKKKGSGCYNLVAKATYSFDNLGNYSDLYIRQSVTDIRLDTVIDIIFLCASNSKLLNGNFSVTNEKQLKKKFVKGRISDLLFWDMFVNGFLGLWLLVGVILGFAVNWNVAKIYFPIGYLVLFLFNLCIETLWRNCLSKIFGKYLCKLFKIKDKSEKDLDDDEKIKTFYGFFTSEFIKETIIQQTTL